VSMVWTAGSVGRRAALDVNGGAQQEQLQEPRFSIAFPTLSRSVARNAHADYPAQSKSLPEWAFSVGRVLLRTCSHLSPRLSRHYQT
jgi:hypothetical protein